MSDNIRTALYDADYSCTLASRDSDAPPVLARVVGKHCEAGDIVVKDEFLPADIRPATCWPCRHRCLLPLDGQQLQPRASAAGGRGRDGVATTIVRRETEDDLLDLGPENGCPMKTAQSRPAGLRRRRSPGGAAADRAGATTWPRGSAPGRARRASPYAGSTRRATSSARAGCSPPTRWPGRARRRRRRGRGHRRHRARPLADPGRARARRQRRHRQQGAAGRGRPDPLRRGREGRARPLLRGGRRRRHPDRAAAARVARRRPGHPGARHRQRHHQLHPRQDGQHRRRLRGGAGGGPGPRVRRGRPDRRRRGLRRGGEGRDPGQPRLPHAGTAADVHREGITEVTAADIASAAQMGSVVKLLAIAELVRPDGAERRLRARAPGDDPEVAPARQRPRGVQRRLRGVARPPAS